MCLFNPNTNYISGNITWGFFQANFTNYTDACTHTTHTALIWNSNMCVYSTLKTSKIKYHTGEVFLSTPGKKEPKKEKVKQRNQHLRRSFGVFKSKSVTCAKKCLYLPGCFAPQYFVFFYWLYVIIYLMKSPYTTSDVVPKALQLWKPFHEHLCKEIFERRSCSLC